MVDFYQNNGQTAIYLIDEIGQPIATLTTNTDFVDEDFVGIRSDNRDNAQWLYDQGLLETGLPVYEVPSGYITIEFYKVSSKLKDMITKA